MNHTKTTPAAPRMHQGSIGDKLRGAFGVGKTRWGMLALVFFATTLNYIDRAALGIMQPVLAKEMSWTAMDYANINFWFQVGYAIGFLLQGRLIDKVGVKRAFFFAVLLWTWPPAPWPGHFSSRLHGLPVHPGPDRGRQLPGLREDRAVVVPGG